MLTDIEMSGLLLELKKLASGDPYGASSKRGSYVGKIDGMRIKARKCFSIGDAARMEARLLRLGSHITVPCLMGRHEEWLFMQFLELPETTRANGASFWEAVGAAIAVFEKVPADGFDVNFALEREPVSPADMKPFVCGALDALKSRAMIPFSFGGELVSFLDDLPACCYGYLDLLAGNMLGVSGRVVFADEEGFAGCIPGMSFVRPLDIWHQYIPGIGLSNTERAWMLDAYAASGGDIGFFTGFYEQISRLYYLMKAYDSLLATGKSAESLKQLLAS